MENIFAKRINIWNETKKMAELYPLPISSKHNFDSDFTVKSKYPKTIVSICNEDSIDLGCKIINKIYMKPLVLIFADNRFAGGDVSHGSAAQEETIFRRTNVCNALLQHVHYPILPNECVLIQNATVFKESETNNYKILEQPYSMDFIACPGILTPKLEHGEMTADDAKCFEMKIKCIFQTAQRFGYNCLVLGPLGCGAWRCPPHQVANLFKKVLTEYDGIVKLAAFACLETKDNDYIIKNRNIVSNYKIFREVLKV